MCGVQPKSQGSGKPVVYTTLDNNPDKLQPLSHITDHSGCAFSFATESQLPQCPPAADQLCPSATPSADYASVGRKHS
jgi:hypothetical protein